MNLNEINLDDVGDNELVLLRGSTAKALIHVARAVDNMRGGVGVLVNHGDSMIRIDLINEVDQ